MRPFHRAARSFKPFLWAALLVIAAGGASGCDLGGVPVYLANMWGSNVTISVAIPLGLTDTAATTTTQTTDAASTIPISDATPNTTPPAGTLLEPTISVTT